MPYPKEFPHYLLGVERTFSKPALVRAMGKAIKENPAEVGKYRKAFGDLADARRRLEYEILLSQGNIELEKELEQVLRRLCRDSYLPQTCPRLTTLGLGTHLYHADCEKDFSQVDFESPGLVLSTRHERSGRVLLPIVFDT